MMTTEDINVRMSCIRVDQNVFGKKAIQGESGWWPGSFQNLEVLVVSCHAQC